MDKQSLRKKYIEIRKATPGKAEKSLRAAQRLFSLPEYKEAKNAAVYVSVKGEADTSFLIKRLFEDGKTVYLPKVKGDEMVFCLYPSFDFPLEKSAFGIPEPKEEIIADKNDIDLFIVPGVSFGRDKTRLGYGGGYYDKYLAGARGVKVGFCFSSQIAPEGLIPAEKTDIKTDITVTDQEWF